MTEQEIVKLLDSKFSEIVLKAIPEGIPERKQELLLEAMHYSMAGWVLFEATDEQMMAIFEKYRPAKDRN